MPEETAQTGQPDAAAVAPETPAAAAAPASEGAQTPETHVSDEHIDKGSKEVARLKNVIKGLQGRLKPTETKEPARETPRAEDTDADPLRHPALKGLPRGQDENEGLVLLHGTWVPPEYALGQAQLTDGLTAVQARMEALENTRRTERFEAASADLQGAVEDSIRAGVRAEFGHAPDDVRSDLELLALARVNTALADRCEERGIEDIGDLDEADFTAIGREAMRSVRRVFSHQQQAADNEEHRNNNRVRVEGPPVTRPEKRWHQLTRAEQERAARRAAEAVDLASP